MRDLNNLYLVVDHMLLLCQILFSLAIVAVTTAILIRMSAMQLPSLASIALNKAVYLLELYLFHINLCFVGPNGVNQAFAFVNADLCFHMHWHCLYVY